MDLMSFKEREISKKDCVELFEDTENFFDILKLADSIRKDIVGDTVTFVKNTNIETTNVCTMGCKFCAFSVSKNSPEAFKLDADEIAKKAVIAKKSGLTEVTIHGGIHPDVDTHFQVETINKVNSETSKLGGIYTHAYSPQEILNGAENAGLSIKEALKMLNEAGLRTIPGTAAEILDDEVRSDICPLKMSTKKWIDIMKTAHKTGIKTTSTIIYGHVEEYKHIVDHLSILKEIQEETGGITEFIPMSFLHENTPLYKSGRVTDGASGLYELKLYAIARILFKESIKNIQAPRVKIGTKLSQLILKSGANDLGGTLVEDKVSKAAGSIYEDASVDLMRNAITSMGRIPKERTTLYEIIE
ncbi:FO synthase subunit 2 [Methanococcus maripaludis]|uniref:5-amino-6-(D-ribitylamino)uracil--L-tyrosine 4-hydroxyphenyl transferase n=1 Tax=Methanococcus maripaludis TaxID=39152 RepID=A0A7J9NY08_METMI|nr:5-amino-6-(D-ribitylamino)uracil--L-tyrosine 4-hydroxyphenyl transferase CofH [Methanococcus maripaludis]MBA2851903.1 FO synthase subunit 2 [Methanococcus maripaludis]